MMKYLLLSLVALVIGCGEVPANAPAPIEAQPPSSAATAEPVAEKPKTQPAPKPEPPPKEEKSYDASWLIKQLESSTSDLRQPIADWGVSPSPANWSTCTIDVGLGEPEEVFQQVWSAWTQPVCSLTLKPDSEPLQEAIKGLIQQVQEAGKGNRESSIQFRGMLVFLTYSRSSDPEMNFFRFSIMGAEAAKAQGIE